MSVSEIGERLKQLKFLNKYLLLEYLNDLEVINVSNNKTSINDFVGQLELGAENKIPHYQLAIEIKTICTKKKVLEAFEKKIHAHISVQVQFNFEDMKKYCIVSNVRRDPITEKNGILGLDFLISKYSNQISVLE